MKTWETMTLEEKKNSYAEYISFEIVQSIAKDRAPFKKDKSKEEWQRAYNPSNGIPYNDLNSLILNIKQQEGNYKNNAWISLNDAAFLGAQKEELDSIFQNKNIVKAKISYIKTHKLEPIFKLDENGEKIPLLDENGKQRYSEKTGEMLFEYQTEVQKDQNGNIKLKENGEPFTKISTQKVAITPTLVTEHLFNIEEFATINKERLKPLNEELKFKNILKNNPQTPDEKKLPTYTLLEENRLLYPDTLKQVKNYLYAQNLEKDFHAKDFRKQQNQKIEKEQPEIKQEKKHEQKKNKKL
ncbi:hypothetical protein CQA57_01255 [Helicobacter anseris]|uniref:N-terminal domain-containing protein n=1 Tax=Helicobacter anseris TaxID=375926 RepID=A0A3D8JAB7_9HELI|nr:ArdC-like ssDNA-binding domain-containing protein [Helicobacter anseris]RDU74368.1 hypothetical protein CQA57_01255 [Helicobacter anseris]